MKIYFPKISLGSFTPRKPAKSVNPFSTKKVTLRVPVLKVPKLGFKLRSPVTKS